jgi:23S rRNA (cytosine1962-C5)-methyltransferase
VVVNVTAKSGGHTSAAASVRLTRKGDARWRDGHPWIFRDDTEPADLPNGEIVAVLGPRGDVLGSAFYGAVSKIALRRLDGPATRVDVALIGARLDAAIDYRETIASGVEALRLVSSDADGLPGLIVDRYGEHLVLQMLTAGIERLQGPILDRLVARLAPASVLARNDAGVRKLEGLEIEVRALHGDPPGTVEVAEGGIVFLVDLRGGQKTGLFLDQRENRSAAAGYLRGRVLDAFCYDGGFALHAARGAESVEAVDASAGALERAEANAARNGITNITTVRANVFDHLSEADRARRRFEGIVLDPPAFAKSRKDLPAAIRAYKEINLRAMRCLTRGGVLVTCSCSYNLHEDEFVGVLAAAAADAGRHAVIVEKRSQAKDHPVLLGLPESHYLKCLILKVD